jgi:glutamate dehydrogenase (NAD(P)+)
VPSVVTGKPVSIGGSFGRTEATGRGVAYCARRAVAHLDIKTASPKVVVQGFGNVGSITAKLLHQAGYTIVAVSDVHGGIYNPKGLDIPRLLAYLSEMGKVEGFTGSTPVNNKELLELPCDVLIPAALGGQIDDNNAHKLQCKIVVEGANGPTTPEADMILHERGIMVVPDILANAGGVTVSYFEWVQGMMHLFWSEDEVNQRLEQIMGRACDQVFELSTKSKLRTRLAALRIGVSRIAEAKRLRGLYP